MRRFILALTLLVGCSSSPTELSDAPPLGWYDFSFTYDRGAIGFSGMVTATGRFRLDLAGGQQRLDSAPAGDVKGVISGTWVFKPIVGASGALQMPETPFTGFTDGDGYKVVIGSNPREMMALRRMGGGVTCHFTAIYIGVLDGVSHRTDSACTVTPRNGP